MPIHIALLRAINVGGRNRVAMADLRDLLGEMGFTGVRTLLQSGNVVFDAPRQTGSKLEKLLESKTEERLATSVDFVVRTAGELEHVIAGNPFTDAALNDPSHLVVVFLKKELADKDVETLRAAIRGPEVIHAKGKHLYAIYPDGIGESKLTNTVIEKTLGIRGTARNWNTVLKLGVMAGL